MKSLDKKKSYSTYSQEQPKRFFTKRLMTLFVIMIVAVLGFYYLFSQYRSIEAAYRLVEVNNQMLSESQEVSDDEIQIEQQTISKDQPLTFLVVGLDYGSAGRLDKQRADVLLTITMNPTTGESALVNISRLLQPDESSVPLTYTYSEGGLDLVRTTVQELLDVTIDFTLVVDLSETRSLIDVLGDNRIEIKEIISLEDQRFTQGDIVHLNGRESILFMQSSESDSDWSNSQRQTQVLTAIGQNFFSHITSWTGVFNAAHYFEAAEGIVSTDLRFEAFISFMSGSYLATLDQLTVSDLKGTLTIVEGEGDMPQYEQIIEQQLLRIQKTLKETLKE